ncbi:MAG TPA: outer membrane protein assembly factor BamA [Bauldia sp.]|nr:outer membrane protein assembly factor BamA [Bauldia sp.]
MRRAILAVVLAAAPVLGLAVPMLAAGPAHAATVSVIVVRGNERIEAVTIKNYVIIKPGKPFGTGAIDQSVKALYDTGLFSDVDIHQAGSSLIVTVVENPMVNMVLFKGNRKVKKAALAAIVQTQSRGMLTDARLEADVQRITDYYAMQGRGSASVTTQLTKLPNNRVDVTFVIVEGRRTNIAAITFVGNSAYSDSRLRSVIISRRHNILSWLNKNDVFDENKLAADQEALRRFYMSHGFADFRVISAEHNFDEAKGKYFVTFTLEEGPRYRFGGIAVDSSIPGVSGDALRRVVKTRPGNVFNATLVEKSIENISIELARQGYAFAQVRTRGDRDYDKNTISITYLIDEGPRVYVERINIYGNTKTRDYVIRREFDISEGDPYNRVMIDRAQRKLNDLGYFKTVSITTEPGSASDRVIVNVMVEDQATGDFSVGGGYTTEGLVGEIQLNEKNFLGRGQQLRISVSYGQHQQSYSLSFTDPYFLGKRMSAGFDLYNTLSTAQASRPYKTRSIGGGVRVGLPITDDLSVDLNYKLSQSTISESTSPIYFPNGKSITSSVGYAVRFNTLDSNIDPHQGILASLSQDFAGVGGSTTYLRSIAEARYFHELLLDGDVVGMVKVGAGNITGLGKPVRIQDNFFQGADTIRGFAPYGYGPRDIPTGTALGGKTYWAATAEVQFPLPILSRDFGLKGAIFADAGQLFDVDLPSGGGPITNSKTIRSSVGASILWASPLGLLRGDFAVPLSKAPEDRTQVFKFSAGKQF